MATTGALSEKTFQSGLPDILQLLFGNKTTTEGGGSTTTSSSSANTGPLEGAIANASQPMSMEMFQNLLAGVFGTAAQQVPTLTAALANATGSRTTGNSPLALALNEQNNLAMKQLMPQLLTYNQQQNQNAIQGASSLASATKNSSSSVSESPKTVTQGAGANPLTTMLVGFLANQADKRGIFDKMGNSVFGGGGESTAPVQFPSASYTANVPEQTPGFTSGMFNLPTPSVDSISPDPTSFMPNSLDAIGSLGGDFFSGLASDTAGQAATDAVSTAIGGVDPFNFLGFADGGYFNPVHLMSDDLPRERDRYADGGPVSRLIRIPGSNFADGGRIRAANHPAMRMYEDPLDGHGIDYADGGMLVSNHPMMRRYEDPPYRGTGKNLYADGGETIRNRNNMGLPIQLGGMGVINGDPMSNNAAPLPKRSPIAGGGSTGGSVDSIAQLVSALTSAGAPADSPEGTPGDPATAQSLGKGLGMGAARMGTSALLGPVIGLLVTALLSQQTQAQVAEDAGPPGVANTFGAISSPVNMGNVQGVPLGALPADAPVEGVTSTDSTDSAAPAPSSTSVGASFGGDNGGEGGDFSDGGMIRGPGTGTSDSITLPSPTPGGPVIHVSNDEFIMPADVTRVPGMKEHFQMLLNTYHRPVRR
jgi:hypothetical protein